MQSIIAVILAVLWGVGVLSSHSMGGFIHLLIILAVVLAFREARKRVKAGRQAALRE